MVFKSTLDIIYRETVKKVKIRKVDINNSE